MESRVTKSITESRTPSTETVMEDLKTILQRVEQKAVERAKAADHVVRGHPYQALGVAIGVGLLVGVLAGRRWRA